MGSRSRFDSAPLQSEIASDEPRWRKWFQDVWQLLNAQALPLPTAVALGASPATVQFQFGGTASIIVSGGTVSLIEFSRDGTTFFNVGTVAGMFTLSQDDRLRITYVAPPTVTQIFR